MKLDYITCRVQYVHDVDPFTCSTCVEPARAPSFVVNTRLSLISQLPAIHRLLAAPHKLSDATLQLYKNGELAGYLDMEQSVNEQADDFNHFTDNMRNSLVVRTSLPVRCHAIIEKLLNSQDRELRRALFSLKQIFQDDKDIVHEFVHNDGLECLVKIGLDTEQKYQNYILRALGQVMLYVDGMMGVMMHVETVQWLYSLTSTCNRLVLKTALKLLLVFVEYTSDNGAAFVSAVEQVDSEREVPAWHGLVALLTSQCYHDDGELLLYAITLINTSLDSLGDLDSFYDQLDVLEKQGMKSISQRFTESSTADKVLVNQFRLYEAVLDKEDNGTTDCKILLQSGLRVHPRTTDDDSERQRKSLRHRERRQSVTSQIVETQNTKRAFTDNSQELRRKHSNGCKNSVHTTGVHKITPAENANDMKIVRQDSEENASTCKKHVQSGSPEKTNSATFMHQSRKSSNCSDKPATTLVRSESKILKKPWVLGMMYHKTRTSPEKKHEDKIQHRQESVKDLQEKLLNQENKAALDSRRRANDQHLHRTCSTHEQGAPCEPPKQQHQVSSLDAVRKSDSDIHWEQLVHSLNRPLKLADLDFTDLTEKDEMNTCMSRAAADESPSGAAPPAPPPPPPLPPAGAVRVAPPPPPPPAPPVHNGGYTGRTSRVSMNGSHSVNGTSDCRDGIQQEAKNRKTIKLFWRELDIPANCASKEATIWENLPAVLVDKQKLEHLFEMKVKEAAVKKQQDSRNIKEIIVLSHKRSNAINISLTKLPPPRTIKTAILKMDSTIIGKEGIERILSLMPSKGEIELINNAQLNNPDLPLATAENFLHTLGSISQLHARLKLWSFKLEYDTTEKEIAEQLMDLKQGMQILRKNQTFRCILSVLTNVGNFLNGSATKGFHLEYLSKVPEVKDTVHKHSLLHHVTAIVMEKFPDSTDLYSEIGAITRSSRADSSELGASISRLESDCKSSWDHLREIVKHDGQAPLQQKVADYLADCAERIILLGIIKRRVMHRFGEFLRWLGSARDGAEMNPTLTCKVISEFALEYRTTRERLLLQVAKRTNHRQRNKTRGKLITDSGQPYESTVIPAQTKSRRPSRSKKGHDEVADADLRQLLTSPASVDPTSPGVTQSCTARRRREGHKNGDNLESATTTTTATTSGEDQVDQVLESLVHSATLAASGATRKAPRARRPRLHAHCVDRRTIKNGLTESQQRSLLALTSNN